MTNVKKYLIKTPCATLRSLLMSAESQSFKSGQKFVDSTRGGPPAWGLSEVLTTPPCKNVSCYDIFRQKALVSAALNLRVP